MSQTRVVFVIDSDPDSRRAIHQVVLAMNLRCEEYSSGSEFLEGVDPSVPGCVISEVKLPDLNGLEVQSRLREKDGCLPLIFLTAQPSLPIAVRAMRAGAINFIQKPPRDGELWDAITEALRLNDARRRQRAREQRLRDRIALLTAEERQLIELLKAGKPPKAIAAKLGVCVRTVELRRARLLQKLQVRSILELGEIAAAMQKVESGAVLQPQIGLFSGADQVSPPWR